MTKAEKTARAWVGALWEDLVDPGTYAGPRMDARTFDVEGKVKAMVPASYAGRVPKASMAKAKRLARKLWDKKVKASEVTPKYTKSALPGNASLAQLWHIGGVNP